MALVRGFVVRISRRKHHAFDAQVHHLVKKRTHALGISSVEQSGVRGYAKATAHGFFNSLTRLVISAFLANGEVMVLALSIHVDGERQILAGLEQINFLLEQKRV